MKHSCSAYKGHAGHSRCYSLCGEDTNLSISFWKTSSLSVDRKRFVSFPLPHSVVLACQPYMVLSIGVFGLVACSIEAPHLFAESPVRS